MLEKPFERLQDKLTVTDRWEEIVEIAGAGIESLQAYMAARINEAYLAGINRLDLSAQHVEPVKLIDTGYVATLAKNYVKDKGYSI